MDLFAELGLLCDGWMATDTCHQIYWEESGNPQGLPALVLHGGPGGGSSPQWRRFFDPRHYRIIQFDQRGSGRSTPAGEWRENDLGKLIGDIEQIRRMLRIDRWLVFGGSWGSTLALAYGQAHPETCLGFILRSIFLGTAEEIEWFFEGGRMFHPELYADLVLHAGGRNGQDLLYACATRLLEGDRRTAMPLAQAWASFECGRSSRYGCGPHPPPELAWPLARLEAWYFSQRCFLSPGQILGGMGRLAGIPAIIIHGRHDLLCRPWFAFRLAGAYPSARLVIVEDGAHSAFDPAMRRALVGATEQFRQTNAFTAASSAIRGDRDGP